MPEPQVREDAQAIKDWLELYWQWQLEQIAYGGTTEAIARQQFMEVYYQLYPEMAVEDRPLSRAEALETLSTADLAQWAEDPMGFRPVERAPLPLFRVTNYQTVINWGKARGVATYKQQVADIEEAAKAEARRLGEERELFAENLKAAGEYIERKRFERMGAWQQRQRAILAGAGEEKRQRLQQPLTPTEMPPIAPKVEKQYEEALKDLPYTAQRFFQGKLGEMFGKVAPAYMKWYQTLYGGFQQYRGTPSGREPYPGETWAKLAGGVMPEGLPTAEEWEAEQVGAEREAGAESRERRRERQAILAAGDPFQQYLQQYPFMGEFMKVPRRQRGFYPGRLSPRAKWYT